MRQAESDVAKFIKDEMHGRTAKRGYSAKDIDALWENIRRGKEWKEHFGANAESVMKELRGG